MFVPTFVMNGSPQIATTDNKTDFANTIQDYFTESIISTSKKFYNTGRRWLTGLKSDTISAQKTFRMLNAFITCKGDLLEEGKPK
jgi:hypothetical protein